MENTNQILNLKSPNFAKASLGKQISNEINELIKELTGEDVKAQVSIPGDLSKGDFSTNIAMVVFGKVKSEKIKIKSPMELAEKIVENLKLDIARPASLGEAGGNLEFLDRIEIREPGFINFFLSQEVISRDIARVLESSEKVDLTGKSPAEGDSSLILEFGDPNPFKEPHIGHLRNFVIGECLARLNEAGGIKMIRANYQGDVGLHVAKAIWGIISLGFDIVDEISPQDLGKAYTHGAQKFESDENAKSEIIEINKKIYEKDSETMKLWEKGRKISLDYFETLYEKLGMKYDKYYFESQTAPVGKEIVEEHVGKVFEKDAGALIFRGEKFGLHTRVFVTKEGHATYEGKDLALAVLKDKDFPDASSIIMTANEQVEYFKVLLKALEQIDKRISDKTNHLSFGFVNLKEGKMSSRTGNVVSAFWLLDEVRKRLKNGFKQVSDDVLDQLVIGAVKWSMLKFSRESNISFSIDESIQIEGNSGPYMQYTYARARSILSNKENKKFEASQSLNLDSEELALARVICQFSTAVFDAKENFSPNILTEYLFGLAQNFNAFYEKKKILGSDREDERLAITRATEIVIKNGLYLLGISAPQKI